MAIKNAILFLSEQPLAPLLNNLDEALAENECRDPGKTEHSTDGFAPLPLSHDEPVLSLRAQDFVMCYYQSCERMLPPQIVNEELAERVGELQEKENRKVGRKERAEIKEQIVFELLPQAFIKKSRTPVIFDLKQNIVFIGATSSGVAEKAVAALRKALGSMPVKPVAATLGGSEHIAQLLASWMQNPSHAAESGFSIGDKCELAQTGAGVSFKGLDITDEHTINYVESGMYPKRINLEYRDGTSLNVTDALEFKSIRVGEEIFLEHEATKDDAEDELAILQADLVLNGSVLSALSEAFLSAFTVES